MIEIACSYGFTAPGVELRACRERPPKLCFPVHSLLFVKSTAATCKNMGGSVAQWIAALMELVYAWLAAA